MDKYYQPLRMSLAEQTLEEAAEVAVRLESPWHVTLFNDEVHAFDEVILQLMKATGCGADRAATIALEAHHTGSSGAYSGTMEACLSVQSVLKQISLLTEISG